MRRLDNHPPRNGCTVVGIHACILTTGKPITMVVRPRLIPCECHDCQRVGCAAIGCVHGHVGR